MDDFDFQAAFEDALSDAVNDEQLAADERIRRVQHVLAVGSSPEYAAFLDFGRLARQMQTMCMHDHALQSALGQNETMHSWLNDHEDHHHDDDEKSDKKKVKKKKRLRWFGVYAD